MARPLVWLSCLLLIRAAVLEELDVVDEAVRVIRQAALSHLSTTQATPATSLRFDIRSPELLLVIGTRHQREEDFH